MNCALEIKLHEIASTLKKDIDRVEELWCDGLARFGGPFLAGAAFTAVDAFYCPVALRVRGYGLTLNATASAYAQRLLDLPAMQEWVAAGLKEPVEPEHEADCLKYGALVLNKR